MIDLSFTVRHIAAGFATKQSTGFVRFVSRASTIGVGLGCCALIVLLSVMNGFERELRENLLNTVAQGEYIQADQKGIDLSQEYKNSVIASPDVKAFFGVNKATGLVQQKSSFKSVDLIGIGSQYEQFKQLGKQSLNTEFYQRQNSIALGATLADELQLSIGDSVQILLPSLSEDLRYRAPKPITFTLIQTLKIGGELDKRLAVVNKDALSDALGLEENRFTHIEFVFHDPFKANQLMRDFGYEFTQRIYISSWYRTHGHLYYDIQLVRTVIYIVLFLLIAIACFNVVSSLVMAVKDKSEAIAILKTMGASHKQIRSIFIIKGVKSTVKGVLTGCLLGCLISIYLSDVLDVIESITGWKALDTGVYFTSSIPTQLEWSNVVLTGVVTIVIAFISTIYPAQKASNLAPANHLH